MLYETAITNKLVPFWYMNVLASGKVILRCKHVCRIIRTIYSLQQPAVIDPTLHMTSSVGTEPQTL